MGLVSSVAAVFTILQTPLVLLLRESLRWQYSDLHALMLGLLTVPFMLTLWVNRVSREMGAPAPVADAASATPDDSAPREPGSFLFVC
jgi:hypothetical protein